MLLRISLVSVLGATLAASFLAACDTTVTTFQNDPEPDPNGVCAEFADEASPGVVTIRFVNQTELDIYLPGGCDEVAFSIEASPPDGNFYNTDRSCFQSCEDLQSEGRYACGACEAVSHRLAPGASREVLWDATGLADVVMPDRCWLASEGNGSCSQVVAAPSSDYTIDVRGYAECRGYDDGPCACDEAGVCRGGDPAGLEATPDRAVLSYPAESVVEVTFGICAFGCAGG